MRKVACGVLSLIVVFGFLSNIQVQDSSQILTTEKTVQNELPSMKTDHNKSNLTSKIKTPDKCEPIIDRDMTLLEKAALNIIKTLQRHSNISIWPVGGTLIHMMRHGRFSDYETHDQEFDLDLAVTSPGNDSKPFTDDQRQWIIDVLAEEGILRAHKLTKKKSVAGTGTCRNWGHGAHITCKCIASHGLKFDLFLGGPVPNDEDSLSYLPLGIQDRDLIHPLGKCRAWSHWIHCPAHPYKVLKIWGVKTGFEPKEGCLLFPRHIQNYIKQRTSSTDEYISYTKYLLNRNKQLDACGFKSFSLQIKEDTECIAAVGLALEVR